jgi:ferredoxin
VSESEIGSEGFAVTLVWGDGRERTLSISREETVLEAAERDGIRLPFGCLTGACATCTAQVLAGSIRHRRPPRALKARYLQDGYVLACIAEPVADCRVRVGSEVAGELVSNPWR